MTFDQWFASEHLYNTMVTNGNEKPPKEWMREAWHAAIKSGGARVERGPSNLSFEGDGRVSVDVDSLLASPHVQEQIKAVRKLAASEVAQPGEQGSGVSWCACPFGKCLREMSVGRACRFNGDKVAASAEGRHG